jgi:serine/threonine protein kinase
MTNYFLTQPLANGNGHASGEDSIDLAPEEDTFGVCSGDLGEGEGLLAGRYQIFKILGRGGFAITYLARNVYLPGQPLCVIKHLVPKFTNPSLLTIAKWRFYVEARTLSQLGSHGQIPLLIDYFRKEGEMYLVQEYVPGDTFFDAVRASNPKTNDEVQEFLEEMLHLLSYLHSCRLIHRDIKPQNIIRCATDDRLVLIDFGAVHDQDGTKQPDNRLTIKAIGTPGYAPPEQVTEHPTYASDIYALGMTCIFLLTGKEPVSFVVDPRSGELRWRSGIPVSEDLADIIDKMIKVSLADRYQSAVQVLQALESRQLRSKLRRYMDTKYAAGMSTVEIDAQNAALPPAVKWAIQMANR